jgi:hypothetical protein
LRENDVSAVCLIAIALAFILGAIVGFLVAQFERDHYSQTCVWCGMPSDGSIPKARRAPADKEGP